MAQAALAHRATTSGVQAPANDNERGPPTEHDKWRTLIDRYKAMNLPSLAVLTAQYKLRAVWTFDVFVGHLLEALEKSIAQDEAAQACADKAAKGKKSRKR